MSCAQDRRRFGVIAGWLAGLVLLVARQAGAQDGACTVEFTVVDRQTGRPVPCRIHLSDQAGKPCALVVGQVERRERGVHGLPEGERPEVDRNAPLRDRAELLDVPLAWPPVGPLTLDQHGAQADPRILAPPDPPLERLALPADRPSSMR